MDKHLEEQKQARAPEVRQAEQQATLAHPKPAKARPASLPVLLHGVADAAPTNVQPSASQIISVVADYFGVTHAQVVGWLRSDAFRAALQ